MIKIFLAASLLVLSGSPPAAVGTAFSLVQSKSYGSTASATSHNLVFTTPPVQNNLLVICVCSNNVITTPSGYSVADSAVSATGTYIYYKVAGASESSTVALVPGSSDSVSAVGMEFSGTATASPLDKVAHTTTGSGATISTGTTATTSQANEVLVAVAGSSSTGTVGILSSWSNSFTGVAAPISSGSTTNETAATAYRQVTSTGAFTTTATFDITLGNWAGIIATFKVTNP